MSKRNKGTIPQPSTINQRLLYASDFLSLAAKSGSGMPFQLHFEKVRDPRTGEECGRRQGNVRQHPRSLRVQPAKSYLVRLQPHWNTIGVAAHT